jgi:hypothetical protein
MSSFADTLRSATSAALAEKSRANAIRNEKFVEGVKQLCMDVAKDGGYGRSFHRTAVTDREVELLTVDADTYLRNLFTNNEATLKGLGLTITYEPTYVHVIWTIPAV